MDIYYGVINNWSITSIKNWKKQINPEWEWRWEWECLLAKEDPQNGTPAALLHYSWSWVPPSSAPHFLNTKTRRRNTPTHQPIFMVHLLHFLLVFIFIKRSGRVGLAGWYHPNPHHEPEFRVVSNILQDHTLNLHLKSLSQTCLENMFSSKCIYVSYHFSLWICLLVSWIMLICD